MAPLGFFGSQGYFGQRCNLSQPTHEVVESNENTKGEKNRLRFLNTPKQLYS